MGVPCIWAFVYSTTGAGENTGILVVVVPILISCRSIVLWPRGHNSLRQAWSVCAFVISLLYL